MSDIELSGDGIGENKMNTCKNCGEPLGADSNYCPNCGTKVPAGDIAQKKLEEMSREELWLFINKNEQKKKIKFDKTMN